MVNDYYNFKNIINGFKYSFVKLGVMGPFNNSEKGMINFIKMNYDDEMDLVFVKFNYNNKKFLYDSVYRWFNEKNPIKTLYVNVLNKVGDQFEIGVEDYVLPYKVFHEKIEVGMNIKIKVNIPKYSIVELDPIILLKIGNYNLSSKESIFNVMYPINKEMFLTGFWNNHFSKKVFYEQLFNEPLK